MEIRTKTVKIKYRWFTLGEQVTPSHRATPLEYGRAYTVSNCYPPDDMDDRCLVFVFGCECGIPAEYLVPAKEQYGAPDAKVS